MARPIVGVALGAGGARGFAHIGVLQALEEHGIPVDVVAGCSMGSLIGGFYASGLTPAFMTKFAAQIQRRQWLDFGVQKLGIVAGDKVRQLVYFMTRGRCIHETQKPFAVVATDLLTRTSVVFRDQVIADAVRASISIPGVFVPYVWNGGVFVDGGVLDPVPVDAAVLLGADVVIAVDVGAKGDSLRPKSMVDVIMQSFEIMQEYVARASDAKPAICIQPNLTGIGISHFHRATDAVAAGYEAALGTLERVKEII